MSNYPDYRHDQYEAYARALLREHRSMSVAAQKRRIVFVFVALIILAIIGLIGDMDRIDAKRDLQHYCQMVSDKAWPDYRHLAASDCKLRAD
jgi:hypothetical protein